MNTPSTFSAQPGREVSHYLLEVPLGSGGMGIVYRATDLRLGRRVALKFLPAMMDASTRARFLHEAQAASSLDHPNICTIFEVDETSQGEIFIAMAYYEGETLDKLLTRGPLEIARAIGIAVQTGRGLAAAHEELIVHRDIKPANLMLCRGETVKILDFGIAKFLREPGGTERGSLVGTPVYISPEQVRGESVDQQTDIWSLGVVLYEMLVGCRPFASDSVPGLFQVILHHEPPPPSTQRTPVPARLDKIVAKALAKSPRHRYEHVEVMVQDLLEIQSTLDANVTTLCLPVATRTSLAVLPFEDMSPAKDQGYLCDGIAEEILRALSRIPDLYVASRTSAFQYKGFAADIREIGARLRVDKILEGSVRRAGERLRVSVQLINVSDGYRLWYERYDREMKDLFALQDEVAEQIAQALEVALGERADWGLSDRSLNSRSYELYLQGRQFFHQHRRKAFEVALQAFTQAIQIDPGNARAYAGIADCHSFLNLYFGQGSTTVAAADAASAKALELGPDLPEAHASRGLALFLLGQLDLSEHHLQQALELAPRHYDSHYIAGRVCFTQGRTAEAARHFRQACTIVPEAFDSWYLLGMCYRRTGENEKARSADLECMEAVKRRVRGHPDDTRAWTMGAAVLAGLGEPERAEEWVNRALAVDADEPIIQYNAACVYVSLGKPDEALACLEASAGRHGLSLKWMANDPDLDPLRNDPRFQELVHRAGH